MLGGGQGKGNKGSIDREFHAFAIYLTIFQVGWVSPAKVLPRFLG